ncbi:MAG: hypothetical protein KatS3mg087_0519 [Patescibacteria group bacterium]|nr:MAG: hypothetical protein KatS3mg087_0519 [Patescibacteria group bacterium]
MSKRRENDFYPTPAWATQELLNHVNIKGVVFEPCAGDGAIADVLAKSADDLIKSDLDTKYGYTKDWHPRNATTDCFWEYWSKWDEWTEEDAFYRVDWTVTNPPFTDAATILKQAYTHSTPFTDAATILKQAYTHSYSVYRRCNHTKASVHPF